MITRRETDVDWLMRGSKRGHYLLHEINIEYKKHNEKIPEIREMFIEMLSKPGALFEVCIFVNGIFHFRAIFYAI